MLQTTALRVLREDDLDPVLELLRRDPVADVFVASRVEAVGLDPGRLGAEMWGHVVDGRLESLCHAGANLVPVQAGPAAVRAFAERARRQGRRCASIVGERSSVLGLWELLEPSWGPAREVRPHQPLMAIDGEPAVEPDPLVRPVRPDELDILVPACVAMFTEEVGVSPVSADGGALYRSRVAELVRGGRAFARIEDGQVLFKAEIGAVTGSACQVQGVWVPPELRGKGLSAPGMAAVVRLARRTLAPVVSLYVNDYNQPALATYRRVGFTDRGSFMSVLF
ncbi:MAG TPA: GNAT family N-acetyltransferase [Actinomycetes bacterium]|nr:GNAT family N-acetyltransferase [Actinomycetes bacterium]